MIAAAADPLEQHVAALANARGGVVVEICNAACEPVFACAAGRARADDSRCMGLEEPCHIASVAKTMTAVLVLQLLERGAFDARGLDMPVAATGFLAPEVVARLHRLDGRSYGEHITLRHLLTHTAGLRDAMVDDGRQLAARGGGLAADSLLGRLVRELEHDPQAGGRHWVPWCVGQPDDAMAGTLNFFLNTPGMPDPALAVPGARFHYSDTGFVLLGLLVEHVAGRPLHRLLRERIFAPLRMRHSYLAYRDDPPLSPQRREEAEVWFGERPLLASGVSLSFDWGGGGVVSTMGDLNRFLHGLLSGRLFECERTLAAMLDWQTPPGLSAPRTGVGLGIVRTQTGIGELVGHSSAWGTKMVFDAARGLYFAGTLNRAGAPETWHAELLSLWRAAA